MRKALLTLAFLAYFIALFPTLKPPALAACNGDPNAIPTAIGCINVANPGDFVGSILSLAMGVAGGIALLLIIYGAFQVLLSAGQPEKVQAGKELITSAITGLLLIIFSVFILEMIGLKVLGLPWFE